MTESAANESTPPPVQDAEQQTPLLQRRRRVAGVIFLAGVLPQLVGLAGYFAFDETGHLQYPLHELLELAGSFIAWTVSMLLMLRLRYEPSSPHFLWIVAGLVTMGLLDAVHAVLPFGLAWSWLRHGGTFVGGVLFALVWLPLPTGFVRRRWIFVSAAAMLAAAMAIGVCFRPEMFPVPWGPDGFTLAAKVTNALGGLGFLAAALYFFKRYLRQPDVANLVFAGHAMLFGTSGLLFGFSHVWAADWWIWHGFRLLAYCVLLLVAYDLVITLYREIARHVHALEIRTSELKRIEWLLSGSRRSVELPKAGVYEPAYGDLTELNTARLILDSVGKPTLTDIVRDFLDLLGTSAAVYEKNGDYALGLFSSGWCQFLDRASRELCGTADNRAALRCGRWHCHESCWSHASKVSIKTGRPVNVECAGGIFLYAVPIRCGAEVIGSLNIGYGDPPRDPAALRELAEKYGVRYDDLVVQGETYESRPPFIIRLAKARAETAARLIGEIVERRRAEDALRLANDRFRRFVDSNIVGILIATPDGEVIEANDYYLKLIGYTRQELERGEVNWRAITPPESLPADERALRELHEQGVCTPYEKQYLRRDGSRVPVVLADTMLPGPGEQIAAFCLDITERKRAEETLVKKTAELDSFFGVALDLLCIISADDHFLQLNPAWENTLGYSLEELMAKRFRDFVHPDDVVMTDAARAILLSQGRLSNFSNRYRRKDGTYCWLEWRSVYDGRFFYAAARDITERKRAEERNQQLAAIVESSTDAIYVKTVDGIILSWNQAAESLYGYSEREAIGQPVSMLVPEGERDDIPDLMERIKRGERVVHFETARRRKDGSTVYVSLSVSPFRDAEGKIIGAASIARDVTERKRAETQMASTVAELRRRQREATRINQMNDLLQTAQTLNEGYSLISVSAPQLFEGLSGGLAILDKSKHVLDTVVQWGTQQILQPVFTLDECWALRAGRPHQIRDVEREPLCRHFATPPLGGYLDVPLLVLGEVLGLLHLSAPPGKTIESSQEQLAATFSEVSKLALSNIKLREALREQAIRDPLTNLFNRRYLDETLPRELHRTVRKGVPLCVGMMDVDHFRDFNTAYGHEAGDLVLEFIGKVLLEKLRGSDLACRYGGEEFTVILPDAKTDVAMRRLEQICDEAKQARLRYQDRILPAVTLSVGIAQAPDHGTEADGLLRAADHALYAAKRGGGDRIEIYSSA